VNGPDAGAGRKPDDVSPATAFAVNPVPVTSSDNPEVALAGQEATSLMRKEKWNEAIAALKQGMPSATVPERATLLCLVGICYAVLRRLEKATGKFQRSEELAREAGDEHSVIAARVNSGLVLIMEKKYPEAREVLELALEQARRNGYGEGEAKALFNLATAYHFLGKHRKARQALKLMSAALSEEDGLDAHGRLICGPLLDPAELDESMGQRIVDSSQFTGAPQDARFVGMAMRGHGLVRQGRFAEAEPDLEQSVEIARKAGEREGEMLLLTALTYVYHKLGRTDKAIVAGERMLELMRELGEPDDLPIACDALAQEYLRQGNTERALVLALEACNTFADRGAKENVAGPLRTLARVFEQVGEEAFRASCREHALAPDRLEWLVDVIGKFLAARGDSPADAR